VTVRLWWPFSFFSFLVSLVFLDVDLSKITICHIILFLCQINFYFFIVICFCFRFLFLISSFNFEFIKNWAFFFPFFLLQVVLISCPGSNSVDFFYVFSLIVFNSILQYYDNLELSFAICFCFSFYEIILISWLRSQV
jgi:hypothetical protein